MIWLFFFLSEEQGCEPDLSHVCCKLTNIISKFNKMKFIIRTQRSSTHGLDGSMT